MSILCSAGFGMIVAALLTNWVNRKKTKAETLLAQAQTQFTGIETYSTMLNDLRTQINMQGDQLKNQAEQILNLQRKESEYVKIIKNYQEREKQLVTKVTRLETELKDTGDILKELQTKLNQS
jgi:chromosome segregation ATPase